MPTTITQIEGIASIRNLVAGTGFAVNRRRKVGEELALSGEQSTLTAEEARLTALWDRMVDIIGIHTVNVLVDRAIWEASRKRPELALIQHSDAGLSFDALNRSYASKTPAAAADAFADLTSELLLILTRLLGEDVAERLAAELAARMPKSTQIPDKGHGF